MSLPDPKKTALRRIALAGLLGALALVSACTVRPLYSNAPLAPGSNVSANAQLASIGVKPVRTRYAQQVRNNLIFGFSRGAGEPASPVYWLDLGVTRSVESSALVQVGTDEDEPTAGSVTLTATYLLTDAKTGVAVTSGKRAMSSSFDRPRQEFAAYRAQIDAESRAARELAEALQLSIVQDLVRLAKPAS